jgi:murein DD-endopeptidase MepM/ murein hydrolase activator NlpD
VAARVLAATALALLVGAGPSAAEAAKPPGYAQAGADTLRQGRAVLALVRAGDVDAIYARFSPQLARAVSRAEVERVLRDTRSAAPIGGTLAESALPMSPARRAYAAELRWGPRRLAFQVVVGAGRRLEAIDLRPLRALPPDPHAGRRLLARLRLPFEGEWWVFWGGPTERQNYHVVAADQRHAYDFVAWRGGATHRGRGTRNADYWAWGRPIVAPAAGVVVAAVDGVRDNRPQVDVENRSDPAGNHVLIDLGNGELALLAHLRRGSVRVRPGQRVRPGEVIGACGNSGSSSEPHLHFHVQDRRELFRRARGLPVSFGGYVADGRRVGRGTPVQGQFIRP